MDNTCVECGESLRLLRKGASYCSGACKIRAYRRRKRTETSIPAELRSHDRWIRWRKQSRNGKTTKAPRTTDGRRFASSTDSGTWSTYEAANASTHGNGLGFVLNGDGIGCIDLDDAIEDGVIVGWAQQIVDSNDGTFIEISQSGNGLHIWGYLPDMAGRVIRDGRSIEVYTTGRYIAMGSPMKGTAPRLRPLVVPVLN